MHEAADACTKYISQGKSNSKDAWIAEGSKQVYGVTKETQNRDDHACAHDFEKRADSLREARHGDQASTRVAYEHHASEPMRKDIRHAV